MKEAWVYIDESQAPEASACAPGTPFWLAALIIEVPVDKGIVERALTRLRNDPDAAACRQDEKTLRRGYFHASFDSKNAHSALCYEIADSELVASIDATQWFFGRKDSRNYEGAGLHRLATMLSTLSVIQSDYDQIHIAVAERGGSFERHHADAWPAYWREHQMRASLDMPSVPTRYPRLNVSAVGADLPGVQVTDFALWALQRPTALTRSERAPTDWAKRMGLHVWLRGGVENGAHQVLKADFGAGLHERILPNSAPARDVGALSDLDRFELFQEICVELRTTNAIAMGNMRVGHLAAEIAEVVGRIDLVRPPTFEGAEETIRAAMIAFLLICDTLPIYDSTDSIVAARATEKRMLAAQYLLCQRAIWLPKGSLI